MAYVVASETGFPGEALASYDQPIPAGHQNGDLLVAIITQDGGGTAIAVSGWTQIGTQAASQAQRTTAFYKFATSSSEADFSATGATEEWIVTIVVVRGADATTPINAQVRTDSANSTSNSLASGTVTTTVDRCLVLYAWGFDGVAKLIPSNPTELVPLGRDTDFVGCVQLVGYTNQLTAGVTPNITALSEVQSEGGSALVIAIADADPANALLSPVTTRSYSIFRRYGGITSATTSTAAFIRHDGITFDTATTIAAATINGLTVINAATPSQVAFQDPLRPWGSMTGISMAGSALDNTGRWVGYSHAVSSTDMSGQIFSLEFMMSTVATGQFGPQGAIVYFQDSSNNWAAFRLSLRAGLVAGVSYTVHIDLENTTPIDSSGTIDWADITRVAYLFHKRTTSTTAVILRIKNALLHRGAIFVDGCQPDPCSPAKAQQMLDGWGPVGLGSLQGGGQGLFRAGAQYGNGLRATYVDATATSFELPLRQNASIGRRFWQIPDNSTPSEFRINASAGDTVNLTACVMATNVEQDWSIDSGSSTSADYDFAGASIVGWNVSHGVNNITINGATFSRCRITLNGGLLDGCTISNSTSPLLTNNPGRISNCAFISPGTGHGIEISATGTFNLYGNTFTGYGANSSTDAAIYNNSGGAVTINLGQGDATPTVRNGAGASTTIVPFPTTASATILADSRVQLYNVTTATELSNTFEAGTSWSFDISSVTSGNTLRLRVTKLGRTPWVGSAVYAGGDIAFVPDQPADDIYDTYALDGSAVTGFAANYVDDTIERTNTSNFSGASFYAWWSYNLTTEDGIRNWFGGVTATDVGNIRINNATVDLLFDITNTSNVYQNDNIRIFRADEAYPVANPTDGGGAIDINWRNVVFTVAVSGSPVITGDISDIAPDITAAKNAAQLAAALSA